MHQLDQLRQMTCVVADTGDIEAIEQHRPVDATTNPSLLLKAAQMPRYDAIVAASAQRSEHLQDLCDRVAVAFGTQILGVIPGRVSTEVDARLSFDAQAMVEKSRHLIGLYAEAGIDRKRVLIKLAATWEGIQAAATLQREGIDCNLTLLFSEVQALAAGQAKAYLISPFVGRILDWHQQRDPDSPVPIERDPGVHSVRNIYRLYKTRGIDTIVMGASFRSLDQVRALAGCDRLTISPQLLSALADEADPLPRRLHPDTDEAGSCSPIDCEGEADFRFQLNSNAMATEKLAEGIRGFVADQIALESLLAARFGITP